MGTVVEFRNFGTKLEARDAGAGGNLRLGGYAAKFNVLSRPLGATQFREKIDPHAFDETLASRPDVRFTMNHDPNHVMGRTVAGTLKLFTDRTGLGFNVDLPNTETARHLVASVKRGDMSDCSFAFRTLEDDWSQDSNGKPIRTLKNVSLHDGDVAAVAYPAYPNTEINARALEAVEKRGRELLGTGGDLASKIAWMERELSLTGRETRLLSGYATVFNRFRPDRRLCFVPGAFRESIARGDLIVANGLGHNRNVRFASTGDGSLKLFEDEYGVRFEIRPTVDRYEFDRVFAAVERREVGAMSIGYTVIDSNIDWQQRVEWVRKATLGHVSPVFQPAFEGTSIRAGIEFGLQLGWEADARERALELAFAEG
jgi:HK97 family phage prohead protease